MTHTQLEFSATVSLALFCVIGAFDGLYYHYFKHKLHLYEETRSEHIVHGLRGIVFAPIALIFFVFDCRGLIYLLGFAFLILDIALEIIDIRVEKTARQMFGGTTCGETLTHIFATGFRVLALAFVIASRPLNGLLEYTLDFGWIQYPPMVIMGALFGAFSLFGGLAHFWSVKKVKG